MYIREAHIYELENGKNKGKTPIIIIICLTNNINYVLSLIPAPPPHSFLSRSPFLPISNFPNFHFTLWLFSYSHISFSVFSLIEFHTDTHRLVAYRNVG